MTKFQGQAERLHSGPGVNTVNCHFILQAESTQAQLLMAVNVLTEPTADPDRECSSRMHAMLRGQADQEQLKGNTVLGQMGIDLWTDSPAALGFRNKGMAVMQEQTTAQATGNSVGRNLDLSQQLGRPDCLLTAQPNLR